MFIYLCRLNYVGHGMIDTSLNVQDVCHQISSIKQVRSNGGKVRADTPDELFDKFNILSVSLPDDATTWLIQLCSSFVSALTKYFSEQLTTKSSFDIPNLTTVTSKAKQLDALRDIR